MNPFNAPPGELFSDRENAPRREREPRSLRCACGAVASRTGIGLDLRPLPPRCETCHRAHDPVTQEYLRQQREQFEEAKR